MEKGDYYSEKSRTTGTWVGQTTQLLGIQVGSEVDHSDFCALVDGFHPKTKEKLAIRMKKDRVVSYDMVFSAPKAVSVLALTGQDARLIDAHHRAAALAFDELEKRSGTRVRKGLSLKAR